MQRCPQHWNKTKYRFPCLSIFQKSMQCIGIVENRVAAMDDLVFKAIVILADVIPTGLFAVAIFKS